MTLSRTKVSLITNKWYRKSLLPTAAHSSTSLWHESVISCSLRNRELYCSFCIEINASRDRREPTFSRCADRVWCSHWQDWDPSIWQISQRVSWYPVCWTPGRQIKVCSSKAHQTLVRSKTCHRFRSLVSTAINFVSWHRDQFYSVRYGIPMFQFYLNWFDIFCWSKRTQ